MRPTLQKYLTMRYPPTGSKGQVPMPTSAATGASFPASPAPAPTPVAATQSYTPPSPPVAGNLVMPWRTIFFAILLLSGAGLLMRAILDGDVRLFKSQTSASVPTVIVERVIVITATPGARAEPTLVSAPQQIIIVDPRQAQAAPVYAQPSKPQQPVQRVERRPLPQPTQAPAPAAWPAPAQQTGKRAVYVCADGAEFPQDDGRWAMFGIFGEWNARGQGDVLDIQDGNRDNPQMGWHYNCRREWR